MKTFPQNNASVLAFASTNQDTHSHSIPLVAYGYPKINEPLANIDTALFVDESIIS